MGVPAALRLQACGDVVGHRFKHIRCRGRRVRLALAIYDRVLAISGADMRHAATDQADHHWLHHREGEQGGDGGVYTIAARRQHFRPRSGAERVVGAHNCRWTRSRAAFHNRTGLGCGRASFSVEAWPSPSSKSVLPVIVRLFRAVRKASVRARHGVSISSSTQA